MNKKFSTLMASLLLAGGFVTNVSAEVFDAAKDYGDQYYRVVVDSRGSIQGDSQWLDVDGTKAEPKQRFSLEENKSTMWTVKKITNTVNGQTTVIGYQLISALTNKPLSVTVKEGDKDVVYNVFGADYNSLYFVNADGSVAGKYYIGKDDELSLNSQTEGYWVYDLVKIDPTVLSKEELEAQNGDSFSIQIGYQEDKNQDRVDEYYVYNPFEGGNAFDGDLYVGKGNETDGFELYKDAKLTQRIVLKTTKWDKTSSELCEGYRFYVLNKKDYDTANSDRTKNIVADKFLISVPATVAGEPIEVVAVDDNTVKHELVVSVVRDAAGNDINRLTVAKDVDPNTAEYTKAFDGHNTYVKFGKGNLINYSVFYGKLWNITKDGEVASPACDNKESFVPAAQVALDYPEGQWLYFDPDGLGYEQGYFQNRESGKKITLAGLRSVEDKENTYTDGESTYTITPVGDPSDKATVGYLNGYTEDQLKQKAFFIGTPLAYGDTLYLTKAANGKLEFSKDKNVAVEFRFTMADFDNDENKSFKTAQTRTAYTIWDNQAAGTTKTATDIVSFRSYTLAEAVSGENLYFDTTNKRFALGDKKGFNPIVIKNKGVDVYNLLFNVKTNYNDKAKNYLTNQGDTKSFCGAQKLYGAHNANELVQSQGAYAFAQNDIFVVVDADAQLYRGDFSNEGTLDTIKIFRNDDPSYVLYEKGTLLANAKGEAIEGFLGMENVNDPKYKNMHAAMLADTAIHANTFRPQYMLAVDAEIVADGWTCPLNPEHNTTEWREEHGGHCADAVKDRPYIQGRYLVNLVDSAEACVNPLKNKFTYEMYASNEPYYRLGFVQAKHIGDSLIIASTNDTINLKDNPYDKACTFAFKYVDAERDAFTIETLYNTTPDADGDLDHSTDIRGYIKYHNGVPVVTPKSSEAWVFDLEVLTGEENAPTANENITAGNVVVAGVNGAVVVKGAEGKNVIVSTILGKVVANEVVSSDNAQIAAPAGIVVVSVDGESFKVVVK